MPRVFAWRYVLAQPVPSPRELYARWRNLTASRGPGFHCRQALVVVPRLSCRVCNKRWEYLPPSVGSLGLQQGRLTQTQLRQVVRSPAPPHWFGVSFRAGTSFHALLPLFSKNPSGGGRLMVLSVSFRFPPSCFVALPLQDDNGILIGDRCSLSSELSDGRPPLPTRLSPRCREDLPQCQGTSASQLHPCGRRLPYPPDWRTIATTSFGAR